MLVNQRLRMGIRLVVAAVIVLSVLAIFIVSSSKASAQESTTANVLRITPLRSDVRVNPGETKTIQMTVSNVTAGDIRVRPIINDFIASDERGTPGLILDEGEYAPYHSLKRFIAPLSDATIPAGGAKTFDVNIIVPRDAQAGGYFGAVRFAPTSPDGGGQVNLSASAASLVLMTVPGDLVEKLTLTDFTILQAGKSGTIFQETDNMQATFRFENAGNVQIGPFGKISVKKGDKVVYDGDFNIEEPRDMVLPDSARRWEVPLDNIDGFGHYTVYVTFTYGQSNQTVEVEESFWVIPWLIIYLALGGLVLLVGIIVLVIFLIRRNSGRRRAIRRSYRR